VPVFHSDKIIHIHVPRCGGTSINALLWAREKNRVGKLATQSPNYHHLYGVHRLGGSRTMELDHLDYCEMRRSVSPWVWKSYRKFAVVRHPWDRFVSEYRRKHSRNDRRFLPAEGNFQEYCRAFLDKVKGIDPRTDRRLGATQFADSHFLPQWRFLGRSPERRDPEVHVLRLESIAEDWPQFLVEAGLPPGEYTLPLRNSQAEKYEEADFVIDTSTGSAIETFYSDDYRMFDYASAHESREPTRTHCCLLGTIQRTNTQQNT
jgi:hypothetical protein